MSRHDPVVKLMSEVREEEHRRRIETAAEVLTALQTFLASRSKRLTTLFLEWDTDGDGSVTLSELTAGLHQMGLELSASELLALFNLFDRDGDGRVDVAEFAFVMRTANTAAAMAELQLKTLKRLSFDSERVRALQNADARFEAATLRRRNETQPPVALGTPSDHAPSHPPLHAARLRISLAPRALKPPRRSGARRPYSAGCATGAAAAVHVCRVLQTVVSYYKEGRPAYSLFSVNDHAN